MSENPEMTYLFTDGACRHNPGPGGWGVLMRFGAHERTLKGSERNTTNNRMELMAAIEGLAALEPGCRVVVVTDSTYVKNGITQWVVSWQRNAWRTSAKKPVKNKDLWQRLIAEVARHQVRWEWVRGHSGHAENEVADTLANEAIDELLGS